MNEPFSIKKEGRYQTASKRGWPDVPHQRQLQGLFFGMLVRVMVLVKKVTAVSPAPLVISHSTLAVIASLLDRSGQAGPSVRAGAVSNGVVFHLPHLGPNRKLPFYERGRGLFVCGLETLKTKDCHYYYARDYVHTSS